MQSTTDRLDLVRSNLLTYLGRTPNKLAHSRDLTPDQFNRFLAELCLDFGNCLTWIQGHLEPDGARHEQPLNETAQSLWALGKQFRAVGLALWDSPAAPESDLDRLRHEVVSMGRALERLQTSFANWEAPFDGKAGAA